MRLQVLTTAIMKMTTFWDIAACRLVKVYRRFRDAYCRNHQADDEVRPHGAISQKVVLFNIYIYIYIYIYTCGCLVGQ
jgi:hypothetical protein